MVAKEVAHAADAAGLVDHQIAAPADQQAQLGDGVVGERDRPEVVGAQAQLVGDDAGVLPVAPALAADAALAGAVDRQAGHVDDPLAGGDQHGGEQAGQPAEHVDANQALAVETSELGDEGLNLGAGVVELAVQQDLAVLVDRGGPVNLLGRVDAYRAIRTAPTSPPVASTQRLRPPTTPYAAIDRTE